MDNIEKEVQKRVSKIEDEYRQHFESLQEQVFSQVQSYLAENISNNSKNSPELEAKVSTLEPVVEAIVRTLKDSGILNQSENVNINEAVSMISELTEAVSEQTRKIKDLQKMLKIHELINQELNGLDKKIVQEAIKAFQGEDIEGDELSKKLIEFVSKRKGGSKPIQFESIDNELNEVGAILEGTVGQTKEKSTKFNPSKKIDIKGISKRIVTESVSLNLNNEDEGQPDEVKEFLRDYGHLS